MVSLKLDLTEERGLLRVRHDNLSMQSWCKVWFLIVCDCLKLKLLSACTISSCINERIEKKSGSICQSVEVITPEEDISFGEWWQIGFEENFDVDFSREPWWTDGWDSFWSFDRGIWTVLTACSRVPSLLSISWGDEGGHQISKEINNSPPSPRIEKWMKDGRYHGKLLAVDPFVRTTDSDICPWCCDH